MILVVSGEDRLKCFLGADLAEENLTGASLARVNLTGASLGGANLHTP